MTYLNVDALQESEKVRGSERIKIGVDIGAGKTAWASEYRRTERWFLVTVISLSAQQLENLSKVASECKLWVADDWRSNIRIRGVHKHRCANHCCLLENPRRRVGVTVLSGDKGYMFHKGSNVATKIDAWVPEGVERFSTYRGCTSCAQRKQRVQHPHGTERKQDWCDATGLPARSEPIPEVPEIQKFQEEHVIQCEMMWMVTRQWCRGCQIFSSWTQCETDRWTWVDGTCSI